MLQSSTKCENDPLSGNCVRLIMEIGIARPTHTREEQSSEELEQLMVSKMYSNNCGIQCRKSFTQALQNLRFCLAETKQKSGQI